MKSDKHYLHFLSFVDIDCCEPQSCIDLLVSTIDSLYHSERVINQFAY